MSDEPQYMTNFTGEDMKIAIAQDSQGANADQQSQPPSQAPTQDADAGATPQPQSESGEADSDDEEETEGSEEDDEEADEPVPDGTSREILAWVGDDTRRAQAALDKEQANDRPRSGLTSDLQKILNDE